MIIDNAVINPTKKPKKGTLVFWTHSADQCSGQFCVIHNPSDHNMKDWPRNWREDRGIMERICQHGCGHPDPDDMNYRKMAGIYHSSDEIHGCCGCGHA